MDQNLIGVQFCMNQRLRKREEFTYIDYVMCALFWFIPIAKQTQMLFYLKLRIDMKCTFSSSAQKGVFQTKNITKFCFMKTIE